MDFEKLKINVSTPRREFKPLDVESMYETDDELLIKLSDKTCYEIFSGQTLTFRRYLNVNKFPFQTISENVTVIREDEDHVIHTTKLSPNRAKISTIYPSMEVTEVDGVEYTVLRCDEDHRIYAQDLDANVGQEIYIKDEDENILASYSGLAIPFMMAYTGYVSGGTPYKEWRKKDSLGEYDTLEDLVAAQPYGEPGDVYMVSGDPYTWNAHTEQWESITYEFLVGGDYVSMGGYRKVKPEDCIEFVGKEETCGKDYEYIETYKYEFIKDFFSTNNLLVEGFNTDDYQFMVNLETKFNPYYFYKIEQDEYGRDIKRCYFYEDNWWSRIENTVHPIWEKYINSGATKVNLLMPYYFWTVSEGFGIDADDDNLGSDEALEEYLENDMVEELIPPVIDMERVKYVPAICTSGETGDEYSIATAITLDFHFRKRELNTNSGNTNLTKNNVYADGWYVADEDWQTAWWNGMDYSGDTFSDAEFKHFLEEKGEVSDLLGYLNFTDDDVYYRKKKVSQTFIRLLFYTSPFLDSQKLLYYSTIFLDSTALFGKYIKQNMFIEENSGSTIYPEYIMRKVSDEIKEATKVVLCENSNVSGRVDSELEVTNEFDRMRSAEGFNLYLFAADAGLKDKDEEGNEKDERTIYMRVEFNHAGNGKTIPMIQDWPKSGDTYVPLTTENYIDSLYIPVKIKYIDNKYIYYLPTARNDGKGNIKLMLFEPKLDKEIDNE